MPLPLKEIEKLIINSKRRKELQNLSLKNFYLLGILIFIKMKLSDNFSFLFGRGIKVKVVFLVIVVISLFIVILVTSVLIKKN